jgi:NADPH-dependent glutamate synthase beta subunit-like oxidoreductase
VLRVTLDGRETVVPLGATVLDAARKLGIPIPTLCHADGCRAGTSCMVCVVQVEGMKRLVPSCAFPAREGMVVHSASAEVLEARRTAVELLLSEHVGDCEGPCRRACPANMNIPQMLRQIAAGDLDGALITVKRDIALPAVLGWICPAPCERACRRGKVDAPVSICLAKRFAGETDLKKATPWLPPPAAATGKKVAIIGAGPAGLAAAYYLRTYGHACTVFDDQVEAGGSLRREVPENALPRSVLDAEIAVIQSMGVAFRMGTRVGGSITLESLRKQHDVVILAVGTLTAGEARAHGVPFGDRGLQVEPGTYLTRAAGVFAIGAAIRPLRLAVRACADGREAARVCDRFLRGETLAGEPKRFNSTIGKLTEAELGGFLQQADARPPTVPCGGRDGGFTPEEAADEARRCLLCDCRKAETCRLRGVVEMLGGRARQFADGERFEVTWNRQHPDVVFEPGKCIKCGLCVRLTEQHGEALGLGFVNRGFATRVAVPFGADFSQALTHTVARVVEACPTGALAWRSRTCAGSGRQLVPEGSH